MNIQMILIFGDRVVAYFVTYRNHSARQYNPILIFYVRVVTCTIFTARVVMFFAVIGCLRRIWLG